MTTNRNDNITKNGDLQANKYDNVTNIFKYLKLKVKVKKILGQIWFNKQCLWYKVTPKYANIKINNESRIAKRVKYSAERTWIKIGIKTLYGKLNKHNKEMYELHKKLYTIYQYIEIEEILNEFGENYIKKKLGNHREKINNKLNKLIENKAKEVKITEEMKFAEKVINQSTTTFTEEEYKILGKSLKYIPHTNINKENTLIECEEIIEKMKNEDDKKQIRSEIKEIIEKIEKTNKNKNKEDKTIQQNIKKIKKKIINNKLITIKADKGNTVIIMEKAEYINKVEKFIINGPYKEITHDLTNKFQAQTKKMMKNISFLSEWQKKQKLESNPQAPKFKCQLKIHKEGMPLRPIVSFISSPMYRMSQEISKIIKTSYEKKQTYNVENSREVIEKLRKIKITENTKLMSLDVKDMYTNIPIIDTMKLIKENNLTNIEYKEEIIECLRICLQQNYFRFNNKFYIQKEGLPMGSPLSPIIAEIFMNDFENKIIEEFNRNKKINTWIRYVDDILILWEGSTEEFKNFTDEINKINKEIKFQEEIGGSEINFLDLNIKINNLKLEFNIYRKGTYTDLIIPADSYHPINHKMAALNSFCHRAVKYLEKEECKNIEIKKIKQIAKNNKYNPKIIDNIIKKIENKPEMEKQNNITKEKEDKFKGGITYIGYPTKKIQKCFEKYKIKIGIKNKKSVFDIIKNAETEDIPIINRSGVYKLKCEECNKIYLGETGRTLKIRMNEHAKGKDVKTTNSLYARHFNETGHTFPNLIENVEIIKLEDNPNKRKLIEEVEILKVKKEDKNKLLNIKVDFTNEDIFYHIINKTTK